MPLTKPAHPARNPARMPPGCELYLPLTERTGDRALDLSVRGHHATKAGTANLWQLGAYGPQLGGFSDTDHFTLDPAAAIFAPGPPLWFAVAFSGLGSSTTIAVPMYFYGASSQEYMFYVNNGSDGQVAAFVRNDASQLATLSANGTAINDGRPHLLQFSSFSSTDHRLALDGVTVATDSTPMAGPATLVYATIGAQRRPTVSRPFPGAVFWAGIGQGAVVDPPTLAADILSGRFSAARPTF